MSQIREVKWKRIKRVFFGPWSHFVVGALSIWLAVRYSVGFPYPDEHFQVAEFAGYKLGVVPSSSLAWEFSARIRSWLQPAFLTFLGWFSSIAFKIEPAQMGVVFRLGSGLLCYAALAIFVKSLGKLHLTPSSLRLAQWASFVFCFIPYLAVRTSSEVFSSCWMLLALAMVWLVDERKKVWFGIIGVIWGLAFLARFQSGFMFGGYFLWLAFIQKKGAKALSLVAAGFVAANLCGVLLDFWGYDVLTSSAWNYFRINILESKAASFGVDPFWSYIPLTLKELPNPLGALTLLTWVACWVLYPRHLLTWISLAFFLGHSAVGHKEARFLYPLFFLTPAMLSLLLSHPWWQRQQERIPQVFLRAIFVVLIVVNTLAMLKLVTKAIKPELAAIEAIVADQDESKFSCALWLEKKPVGGTEDLAIHFYVPHRLDINSGTQQEFLFENPCVHGFYLYGSRRLQEEGALLVKGFSATRCEKIYTDPVWLHPFKLDSRLAKYANGTVKEVWRCPGS